MSRRMLLLSLVLLLCPILALADTLVVAGHKQELTSPFIMEGEEVLAPVVPSLRFLGARVATTASTITITTSSNKTLQLTLGATHVQYDGRKQAVPAAPRQVDGDYYLPVRALAGWLGAECRFDAASRTLTVTPLVTVTYDVVGNGVAIQVRSAAQLQYTSGRLTSPARFFFDFKNAALGLLEQQVPVQEGPVERIRLSQYSTNPDTVRMVVDLSGTAGESVGQAATVEEQGKVVTITIGDNLCPTPATVPTPSDTPVKLLGVKLTKSNPQQSELLISSDGPVRVDADFNADTKKLVLHLANALNTVPADQLGVKDDKVVKQMAIEGSDKEPGATLTIAFKGEAGYLLNQDAAGLHVLMGAFNIGDMIIVLDAGHGGGKSGAVGVKGTLEKNIALDVVLRTEKLLRSIGAKVYLTRSDDSDISLDDRPALSNRLKADLFISVHCNSSATRNSCSGSETYYQYPGSAPLAAAMHAELLKGTELRNGGIRTANFAVLRKNNVPAVLLEIAYINNAREERLLNTPEFRQHVAEAIVNGIRRFSANKSWLQRRSESLNTVAQTPADTTP
ncbi:MAG: N-acetylmuramoyl-L-alanine amidase [Armatimonadota bacterium]